MKGIIMFHAHKTVSGATWIDRSGEIYGAQSNELGLVGGGSGYKGMVSPCISPINTLDDLLNALRTAQAGDVIHISGKTVIDCTERVFIDQLVLEIPEGVTLAGDRGRYGSSGAMIMSDTFATRPLIRALGPRVRVTGLRIRGPYPHRGMDHHRRSFQEGRGHEYYYKFPVSDGIDTSYDHLEVDNCELAGWSHSSIFLKDGKNHHVHHNFIHHNQYNGLGYGISHVTAYSLIECNLFNHNRHSIAATGSPDSGYEARHNIEMGVSLSHCFDMHGGRDRGDGTDIAGKWINVHHNTFRCPEAAVVIRGVPTEGATIYNNWFHQNPDKQSVRSSDHTTITNNLYGMKTPQHLASAEPIP